MSTENRPSFIEFEPQSLSATAAQSPISEDDKLLCARTNVLQMLNGDKLSKELIAGGLEVTGETTAQFKCPVPGCPALCEFDTETATDRRSGDCTVVMAGILKAAGRRSRGMTFAEFAKTSLGEKMIR